MEHNEIYTQFCQPEFDEVKAGQKEIIVVLKGKNGDPGLCEQVRDVTQRVADLEETKRAAHKAALFIVGAISLQFVADAWGWISGFFKGP